MKKILASLCICFAVSYFANKAFAENLGIVNYTGSELHVGGYDELFDKCTIPDEVAEKYLDKKNNQFNFPPATVAYFSIKDTCKNTKFLFHIGNSFFGYNGNNDGLEERIEYKFVDDKTFVYLSQDLYHNDGIVIGYGLNGN